MRFFRYNNHLLWIGVLICVALCVYGVMYMVQMRNSISQRSEQETNNNPVEKPTGDTTDENGKHVQFAEPIENIVGETHETEHITSTPPSQLSPQYVFMDVAKQDFLKDPFIGKIVIQLHPDVAPKTCMNFAQLCADKKYVNTPFHRVIKDFMLQGGDIVHQDGTGTYSIYGGEGTTFKDEAFVLKHDRAGALSMANSGPDTNGSQFFITTRATPHLDGKHVVFGHVVQGIEFVTDIEREMTDANDSPIRKCYIMNCGVIELSEMSNTQHKQPELQTNTQPPSNIAQIQQQHFTPEQFTGVQPIDSNMSPIHNRLQLNSNLQEHQPPNMSNNQMNEPSPFSL